MKNSTIFGTAAMLALSVGFIHAQRFGAPNSSTTSTVTDATGNISQLNYGPGGNVQGFLIGTKILLMFPGNVSGGVGSLGAVGNSVTYSGSAVTASSGFQSVRVTTFTNTTTKATYTAPTSTSATYGPTSGKVDQLNYQPNGAVDGFLFTPTGAASPILVTFGRQQSGSTLSTALVAGATVAVTGNSRTTTGGSTTAIEVVHATQLAIDGQNFVFGNNGGFGGRGPGNGRPF